MMTRPLALTLVAVTLGSRLSAQRIESSLDLSGTNVWYGDSIRSGGASLNPSLRVDWPRATLSGAASISRLAGAGASAQGALVPSILSPSVGPFTAELTGALGGSTHADGSRTGQAIGLTRAYAMTSDGSLGSWLGGGVGRTWDGAVWRDVRQGDVGAWFERAGVTTLATIAPVIVEDTIRYTDVQAALRYPIGIYELGATGGVRTGAVGAAVGGSSRAWASVSLVAWVRRGLAIVASGGSYPVDFTQGYPGGRFVSVAMRVASGEGTAHSRAKETPSETPNAMPSAPKALAFELREARGGRELRVYAPAAHSVEIDGDFTRWEPLALERGQDGWWSAVRPMSSGSYQVNLRVDGGAWIAPPGLLAMRDEFGGIVGILTIP